MEMVTSLCECSTSAEVLFLFASIRASIRVHLRWILSASICIHLRFVFCLRGLLGKLLVWSTNTCEDSLYPEWSESESAGYA
jgi:hypothetical protein